MPDSGAIRLCRRQGWLALSDLMVVLGCCMCVHLPLGVSGHGYLSDPPSRSSAWRSGFQNPANYNDNELYCGGFNKQWNQNGGKCGICGDPWDAPRPRPNEIGGKYANGIIVRQYSVGQVVVMSVTITAQHNGWFEFRLCPESESIDAPTTQECLDANLLEVVDGGQRTRYHLPSNASRGLFNVKVKLPEGVACSHCVLQWKWHVANSWGVGSDGVGCLGCGPQEEFVNCADISISSATTTASPSLKSSISPTRRSTLVPSRRPPSTTTRSRIVNASSSKRPITTVSRSRTVNTSKTTPKTRTANTSKATPKTRTVNTSKATPKTRTVNTSKATSKTSQVKPSSTVMPFPAVSTKRSSSGCRAIGLFEGNGEMDNWCVVNCARNFCPGTHCKCDQGVDNREDFTVCKSKGIGKSNAMDKWCVSNCAAGYCPSALCQC